MCDIRGKKIAFDKNNLKKTIFFVEKQNNKPRCIVIKKIGESIILFGNGENHNFQEFIKCYEDYFDIKIQNLEAIDSSSRSVLIKKVYYHE